MKNKRGKKNTIFILSILSFTLIVITFYYLFIEKTNPFQQIFETITKKEVYDNYNGVYVYSEPLDKTYTIYPGCSITKIDNYILIKNNKYYTYRSSCMGTYYREEGKTSDLNIIHPDNTEIYKINYHDIEYVKSSIVNYVIPNNKISEKLESIDINSIQIAFNETQFPGNRYSIRKAVIKGINGIFYDFNVDIDTITLYDEDSNYLYQYYVKDYSRLPKMYTFGNYLGWVEEEDNFYDSNKYGYNLLLIDIYGPKYNLQQEFPISVNNDEIRLENHSVFIKYNTQNRYFTILIGNDKKMCEDNSTSTDIAYYEFKVSYDYKTKNFSHPEFQKIGYKNEGCNYVNRIIGGS